MAPTTRPGEFELIRTVFAPLARDRESSLGLTDDAALLRPSPGCEIVITTDVLVADVHFRALDAAEDVGWKALVVNLSDLAAMGAEPRGYVLATAWSRSTSLDWIRRFADGLAAAQERFGIALLGGDTVSTAGPVTVAVTALGELPVGTALLRSGAAVGDRIYVSGTLGDAALGLAVLQGRLDAGEDGAELVARYLRPEPRLALGRALRGIASACLDVSDGTVGDLAHICETSGVGALLRAGLLPLSAEARRAVDRDDELLRLPLTGGDDYELLFTAPPERHEQVLQAGRDAGIAVTAVGDVVAGDRVVVLDPGGREMKLDRTGWRHD